MQQNRKEHGIKVLYNPAPSRPTDKEMIDFVDYVTPNQHECQELFPERTLEENVMAYPNKLIVTLGSQGSIFFDGSSLKTIPAIKADVVDTTGAGDTFNGAFGFALTKQLPIDQALQFATLASHLSVQKFGAQGGMPTLEEMRKHQAYEKTWDFK